MWYNSINSIIEKIIMAHSGFHQDARSNMLNALEELKRQDDAKSASTDYLLARDRLFEAVEQAEIEEKDLPAITQLFIYIKAEKSTQLEQGEEYRKRSGLYTHKIQSLQEKYPDIYR